MSKLARFDRVACKVLRNEIDQALQQVADKYGINIKAGNATFTDNNITFKLQLSTIGDNGLTMTKEAEDFKRYAFEHGLSADKLFAEFTIGHKTYTLLGYKPRSTRYPFIAKCHSTGQTYKLPEHSVKRAFA